MTPTDKQLIAEFRRRHTLDAMDRLIERHRPMVARVCCGMLNQSADIDDAVQMTFLTLTKKLDQIGDRHSIAGWLFHCAVRNCRRIRYQNSRRRTVDLPKEQVQFDDSPEVALMRKQNVEALLCELNRLPAKYREVIVLVCLEERTRADAAKLLNRSEAAVKGLLARGRALLRSRLGRGTLSLVTALASTAKLGARCVADETTMASLAPDELILVQLDEVFQTHRFQCDRLLKSCAWYSAPSVDTIGAADAWLPLHISESNQKRRFHTFAFWDVAAKSTLALSLTIFVIAFFNAGFDGPRATASMDTGGMRGGSDVQEGKSVDNLNRSNKSKNQDGETKANHSRKLAKNGKSPSVDERKWIIDATSSDPKEIEKVMAVRPRAAKKPVALPSGKVVVKQRGHYSTGETGFRLLIGEKKKCVREFLDTNGDETIDSWTYFLNDNVQDYCELDTDFDTEVDFVRMEWNSLKMSAEVDLDANPADRVWDLQWPSDIEATSAPTGFDDSMYLQPGDELVFNMVFGEKVEIAGGTVDKNYQLIFDVGHRMSIDVKGRTKQQFKTYILAPHIQSMEQAIKDEKIGPTKWSFRRSRK